MTTTRATERNILKSCIELKLRVVITKLISHSKSVKTSVELVFANPELGMTIPGLELVKLTPDLAKLTLVVFIMKILFFIPKFYSLFVTQIFNIKYFIYNVKGLYFNLDFSIFVNSICLFSNFIKQKNLTTERLG